MERDSLATRLSSLPHLRWELVWRWMLAIGLSSLIAGCASLPDNVERPGSAAWKAPEQPPLGELVQRRGAQEGARSESGFRLLDSVDAAFSSRLALIQSAQRSLDLQYYSIHADSSTEILLQALR